jgi:hypothetical protein
MLKQSFTLISACLLLTLSFERVDNHVANYASNSNLNISQLKGKHFKSLEEDLSSFLNRVIDFARTGIYTPYPNASSSKLLKSLFTMLVYKGRINKLSDMDKMILVYLIVDMGKRRQDEQDKMPVFWLSRQGRR